MGIDGLTVVNEIGRGGFGAVYLAHDEAHGRQVAVKVLTGSLDESARRRFDRERRAMGTLSGHPNIGVVHTSGFTESGQAYIVMEHLSGGSLDDRLATDGALPVGEVIDIGLAMADALGMAHRSGVLHLDVKPANVLYSAFGRPKLVDFGIAAIVGDEQATTTIRATPAFAAPEIFEGQQASPVADVYGLAATMYALLMGGAPYTTTGEESALQILREVAVSPVPTVERPDVPAALRELLGQAMSKDPTQRPQSMQAFREQLQTVGTAPAAAAGAAVAAAPSQGPPTTSQLPPPSAAPLPSATPPSGRRGQRLGVALLGLAAVVGVAALAIVLTRGDDDGPQITTEEPTPEPTAVLEQEPTAAEEPEPTVEAVGADTTPQPTATSVPTPRPPATPIPTATPPGAVPRVPDVTGLSEFEASTVLINAGYTPIVNPHCYLFAAGTFPAPGAQLALGSTVEVLFDPCIVPDFVGLTLDEAVSIIEVIDAIRIEWPAHCEPVILGQSVAPGTVVAPLSTIVFLELRTPPC